MPASDARGRTRDLLQIHRFRHGLLNEQRVGQAQAEQRTGTLSKGTSMMCKELHDSARNSPNSDPHPDDRQCQPILIGYVCSKEGEWERRDPARVLEELTHLDIYRPATTTMN
jgi:hypothetical protein